MPVRRATLAWLMAAAVFLALSPAAVAQEPQAGASHPQLAATTLTPGATAIVDTDDGGCLRLRSAPSLAGERLSCVPEGRTVLVLPATQQADGYRWQLIEWRGQSGWAADIFLKPYFGPPVADSCQAQTIAAGITGEVPSQGGFGLIVWGGGTLAGLETATLSQGCRLSVVWATLPTGGFVSYRFGVPDFVNRPWYEAMGEVLAAGTPLMIVCAPPGTAITTRTLPLPAASGSAPIRSGGEAPPALNARAAIVIDEASGAILFEHNAHQPVAPASLTKIVTAILALEGAPVDAWVPITDVDYRQMPGSSVMGIVPGDCFTMRDLLYGLMLPSGNDAALAIARYQAGSDEAFVAQMNTLVRRLGLSESNFTDPHGLGSSQHRMSAHDVAMLSRYGMTQVPLFREIVAQRNWTAAGDRDLSVHNVNSFLTQFADADGVKTGYTEEAGRTLSASATRNGHRLYAVILNDNNRYATAGALLDWAFENHSWP